MRTITLACLLALGCAPASPDAAADTAATPNDAAPVVVADTLPVAGGAIHYEVAGAGPAVVLVHGGFGDRRMWDAQFRSLARDHRVVRYDHRGFGLSAAPTAAYSPVADLLALLDTLGIERAHLVGNSMGGGLVLDFALTHPSRAASIAMVATGPNGWPATVADRERFAGDGERIRAVFDAASTEGPERAAELWAEHPMVGVASRDSSTAALVRTMIRDNSRIFRMEHWPAEPMKPTAFERLAEVRTPTLLVIGDRDVELVKASAGLAAERILREFLSRR